MELKGLAHEEVPSRAFGTKIMTSVTCPLVHLRPRPRQCHPEEGFGACSPNTVRGTGGVRLVAGGRPLR